MNTFLSQEEVDALLRGITIGDIETEQDEAHETDRVQVYDLANQENQSLARLLRAALSGALRRIVDVTALNVDLVKFGEFLKTLPVPTSMHIFRMHPLRGGALMVIESKLVFALIDSFFGGPGNAMVKIEGRDFTPIESHMIDRVVHLGLGNLEKAWESVEPITTELERSEVNPQFVGIVPPSDIVVLTPFEIEMDEARGNITLCIPYSTIEPLRNKLVAAFQSERLELDYSWVQRMVRQMQSVEVEVSAELGSTEVTVRHLLDLQIGDIICLDQNSDSEIVIRIEGTPKFLGLPRVIKQRKALEITSRILPPEEDEDE
jgi:flagellar motor switch protein FliM